jgi:hypothetical protein
MPGPINDDDDDKSDDGRLAHALLTARGGGSEDEHLVAAGAPEPVGRVLCLSLVGHGAASRQLLGSSEAASKQIRGSF